MVCALLGISQLMGAQNYNVNALVPMEQDPLRPKGIVPIVEKPGRWRTPGGDERRRSNWGLWTNYDDREGTLFPGEESWRVGDYPVLDLLTMADGTVVKSSDDWFSKRRPELEEAVRREILGYLPDRKDWPSVSFKRDGENITGVIDCSAYPQIPTHPEVQAALRLPASASASKPVPVMIVIASLNAMERYWSIMEPQGWGVCVFNPLSMQPDNSQGLNDYLVGLFNKGGERKPEDIGAIGAWSWGISRLIDCLETVPGVDRRSIGITGHSRFGKTALFAAAFDTRIACCFPSDAGCGGTATWRRHWGEDIEVIGSHWFCGNLRNFCGPVFADKYMPRKVGQMSVDAYTLVALCAPRPVFINCGYNSQWADPYGIFLTARYASPVYELLTGRGLVCEDAVPVVDKAYIDGPIGFRLHKEGHTDEPDWPWFFKMMK